MADVTIAPSDEACQALVAWINDGDKYTLPTPAEYSYKKVEDLSEVMSLKVDVIWVSAKQLNDSLDAEDPSLHELIVWVRDKLPSKETAEIAARNLIFQQIYQRVNAYRFSGNRVAVRECGYDDVENPDKDLIETQLLFKAGITVRAEVKAPE